MASVSLHRADRMRFLGFPPEILNMLRDTIKQSWPLGIQLEKPYGGSHEYVLWGFPWDGKGQAGIEARRLVRNVLAALYGAGWILIFSTDVSKKETDKDTMIFRHQMPPPPPSEWISIAFSQFNMVRLIDVPPDLSWELHNALTIARLRREPHQYSQGVTEIALNSLLVRGGFRHHACSPINTTVGFDTRAAWLHSVCLCGSEKHLSRTSLRDGYLAFVQTYWMEAGHACLPSLGHCTTTNDTGGCLWLYQILPLITTYISR